MYYAWHFLEVFILLFLVAGPFILLATAIITEIVIFVNKRIKKRKLNHGRN